MHESLVKDSYKVELAGAFLSIEVVTLQIGQRDEKVDEYEDQNSSDEQVERIEQGVRNHFPLC